MEEEVTQENQPQLSGQNEKKPSKKIIILVIVGLFLILILTLTFARAYLKNSSINAKSDLIRQIVFNQIHVQKDEVKLMEQKADSSESALEIINQNKQYIQNQINDLKTKGETKYYIIGGSYICTGGLEISAEDFIFNEVSCPGFEAFLFQGNDKNIEITTSSPLIIREIFSTSSKISLQEYSYNVLEENKYELEAELSKLSDQDSEIENKLSEIKKNSGAVLAQNLDLINYISKKSIILFGNDGLLGAFKESYESKENVDFKLEFEGMEVPNVFTEQEINSVELKSQCIEVFDEIMQDNPQLKSSTIEEILLIKNSMEDVCESLEKYQKQNAIKMLKRMQTEQNPFIKFENAFYLNSFINCNEGWFNKESNECIKTLLTTW